MYTGTHSPITSGANCEALVELECIELLLCLLQCSDLSVSTKLNVVVCLGMLTEENGLLIVIVSIRN